MFFKSIRKNKEVHSDSHISDYQNEIFNIIKGYTKSVGDVSVIIDVGAHVGAFSIKAKSFFNNAKVLAFEPYKKSFDVLNSNLSDDYLKFNIALSDFTGNQFLNINVYDETNSLFESSTTNSTIDSLIQNTGKENVKVNKLDNILQEYNIKEVGLLKVDVQGSELNVLKGCKEYFSQNRIKFIQCEVEFIEIYKTQPLYHEVAQYLYNSNFKLYSLFNLHYDINDRLSWADALFIHSDIMQNG